MEADFGIAAIKMGGSLIIILVLILLLYYLLKRFRLNSFSQSDIPPIRLLGTLNIAPKRSIAMVEICNQWLVVGIGVENINLLTKLECPPDVDKQEYCDKSGGGTFQSFLRDIRSVKNIGKNLIPR